jgi:putative endonuclease
LSNSRQKLGKFGEKIALQFLKTKGFTPIAKNYRLKTGEIDIIAMDGNVLVFIEVKTRQGNTHGTPLDSITWKKQRQISKVAQEYLSRNNLFEREARFDVLSVICGKNNRPEVEHISNAFELNFGF